MEVYTLLFVLSMFVFYKDFRPAGVGGQKYRIWSFDYLSDLIIVIYDSRNLSELPILILVAQRYFTWFVRPYWQRYT